MVDNGNTTANGRPCPQAGYARYFRLPVSFSWLPSRPKNVDFASGVSALSAIAVLDHQSQWINNCKKINNSFWAPLTTNNRGAKQTPMLPDYD